MAHRCKFDLVLHSCFCFNLMLFKCGTLYLWYDGAVHFHCWEHGWGWRQCCWPVSVCCYDKGFFHNLWKDFHLVKQRPKLTEKINSLFILSADKFSVIFSGWLMINHYTAVFVWDNLLEFFIMDNNRNFVGVRWWTKDKFLCFLSICDERYCNSILSLYSCRCISGLSE